MQLLVNSPQSPAVWQMWLPPGKDKNTHINTQKRAVNYCHKQSIMSHWRRSVKTSHFPPAPHITLKWVTLVSFALPTPDLIGLQPTHLNYYPTLSHLTTAVWDNTSRLKTIIETMNMCWYVGIPNAAGIQCFMLLEPSVSDQYMHALVYSSCILYLIM